MERLQRRIAIALFLAALGGGCAAPKITGAPLIAGRATFPESGGVTSGMELSTSTGVEIIYIDFAATDTSGKALVEFRWKPYMKAPYYQTVKSDVANGETWKMKAFVLYRDTVLKSRHVSCSVPIATDGTWTECKMD